MPPAETLAERFVRFADEECGTYAPTYDRLARLVATAPDLLEIAATAAPGQQHPNTFMAACHRLFGADLVGMPGGDFLAACRVRSAELAELCATRLVQTNEPRRATFLFPALVVAGRRAEQPLHLVEVGASAGLLLLVDRYGYDYGWAGTAGDPSSPLVLDADVRGDSRPPLDPPPIIADRVGIDLHPVRPDDPESVGWLQALVWPDHPDRRARLDAALSLAAADPPPLLAGDVFDVLPGLVADIPAGRTPLVFHHATVAHMAPATATAFGQLIPRLAAARDGDLLWLYGEGGSSAGRPLVFVDFRDGNPAPTTLASVHGHGAWLSWAAAGAS